MLASLAMHSLPSPLDPHDDAGDVLTRAYYDDPALTYILPTAAARARHLSWLIDTGVRYGHRFGEVFTTGAPAAAAAVCLPPGETTITADRLDDVGFVSAPARLGADSFARFNHLVGRLVERHVSLLPEPHWYLMMLGVDTTQQRQGLGGALLERVLARVADDALPCYVETAQARNVTLLARHGFTVAGELDDATLPRMWLLTRR